MQILRLLTPLLLAVTLMACESKEQRAEKFYLNGQKYYDSEEIDAAKIEFANALKLNEGHLNTLLTLSELYKNERATQSLYKTLQKILTIAPENLVKRKELANLLIVVGQLDLALEQSNRLLELAPNDADVQVIRAGLLYKLGDNEGGSSAANKALTIDPGATGAAYLLALSLIQQSAFAQARTVVEQSLAHQPGDMQLSALQVHVLNQLEQPEQAVTVLLKLLEDDPQNSALVGVLAKQYMLLEQVDKAKQVLGDLARQAPTPAAILNYVSFLQAEEGVASAEQALIDFTAQHNDFYELHFALTELFIQENKLQRARQQMWQLLATVDPSSPVAIDIRHVLIRVASSQGNDQRVYELVDEILALDPGDIRAINAHARKLISEEKYDQAISQLRGALSSAPDDPYIHLLLGRAHEQRDEADLARDHYARAFQNGETDHAVVEAYSAYWLRSGNAQTAERILEKALDTLGASYELLKLLAQAKIDLDKWQEAEQLADRLAEINTNSAVANQIRGVVFNAQQDYQSSINAFEQVHQQQPDSMQTLASLVGVYLKAGQRQQAEAFLRSTIELNENNVNAKLVLASMYEHHDETSAAKTIYHDLVAREPQRTDLYTRLIGLYLKTEDYDAALSIVEQSLEQIGLRHTPQREAFILMRGQIEEARGDRDTAIATYRHLLEKNPDLNVVVNNLALLLLEKGKPYSNESLTLVERFRRLSIPQYLDTLGWVYLHSGKIAEGLYFIEKAVDELPNIAEVRYHLGAAYLANGRNIEARVELKKALQDASPKARWRLDAKAKLAKLEPSYAR